MFYFGKVWRSVPALFLCMWVWFGIHPSISSGAQPVILALGDSLTAGFGVIEQENYPHRLQKILSENGYAHKVVNAGVSGDTTAGGLSRLNWLLRHKPEIVILCLGANDGLRGLPPSEMYANLKKIIETSQEHGAKVLLAGIKVPPNLGIEYAREFENVFTRLAAEYKLNFIPFLLEGVAAKREYTLDDGIHPRGKGYAIVAETVWETLKPML